MSGFDPTFDAAGAGTRDGSVPAPGAIDGRTYFLRADKTWAAPGSSAPGKEPPAPGPDLDQWACNIAGYLTYDVSRLAVKYVVDWLPVSWIGDVAGGIVAGIAGVLLPASLLVDGVIEAAIFHWVSSLVSTHLFDVGSALVDDVAWAKIHCALYDKIKLTPTDLHAAILAFTAILGGLVGWTTPAVAAITYLFEHLGIADVGNIPITAFVREYDCTTCAMTGIGPTKPVLQSSFDLSVTDDTTTATFVDTIEIVNGVVSRTGSKATITIPPDLSVTDGSTTVAAVDSLQFNNAVVSGSGGAATVTPNIATASTLGIVEPDNTSCWVDSSGILHVSGGQTLTVNLVSAAGSGKVHNVGAGGTPPAGWETSGFADGSWAASVSSSQTSPVIGGSAWLTWQDGDVADGDIWLYRLHFTPPAGVLVRASIQTKFDNWSIGAYTNGTLILAPQSSTTGITGPTTTAILPGLITPGSANVLAIGVENTSGVGHPNGTALDFVLALTYAAALAVQHNDAAVATESALDFEDSGSLTWTVADDPSNTRVKITGTVGAASALLSGYGVLAARPAAGTAGALYYATDTHLLYRDSGSAWVTLTWDATEIGSGTLSTARGGLGGDSSAFPLGTILAYSGSAWTGDHPTADGQILTSDSSQPGGTAWKVGSAGGTGGMIGLTAYRSGSDSAYTITAGSLTVVDATHLTVTFTAPASGTVLVRLTGQGRGDGTHILFNGVLEGGTSLGSNTVSASGVVHNWSTVIVVTGVSAGSHTYSWGAYMQASATGFITTGPTSGELTMEVWAI